MSPSPTPGSSRGPRPRRKTLPFDREAVAALVSHEVRQAENRGKISLRFSEIADIIREASHWAGARSQTVVTREDVRKAVDERLYRSI
jgi:predicted ATP-dependent protease